MIKWSRKEGVSVKIWRLLFGVLTVVALLLFLFVGVKKLEVSEKTKLVEERLSRSFHKNPDVYAWIKVELTIFG